jgi:hypothetical protein
MPTGRDPHIGEYVAKTNAVSGRSHTPTGQIKPMNGPQRQLSNANAALLPVVFQHLIAGRTQLGTMLLKASQNREVALIDHRTAEALNVARTSRLLLWCAAALLLLGDGCGGNRQGQQGKWQEKLIHRVPSF